MHEQRWEEATGGWWTKHFIIYRPSVEQVLLGSWNKGEWAGRGGFTLRGSITRDLRDRSLRAGLSWIRIMYWPVLVMNFRFHKRRRCLAYWNGCWRLNDCFAEFSTAGSATCSRALKWSLGTRFEYEMAVITTSGCHLLSTPVSVYSLCRFKYMERQETSVKYHKHNTLIFARRVRSLNHQALAICILYIYIYIYIYSEVPRMMLHILKTEAAGSSETMVLYLCTKPHGIRRLIVAVCLPCAVSSLYFVSRVVSNNTSC